MKSMKHALLSARPFAMLCLALINCGPAPTAKCDSFDFLSNFHPTSGIEINCRQVYSDSEWLTQSFTEYTDGRSKVVYWANSLPIRIEGDAPACLLAAYHENIPRAPMLESDCVRAPFVVTPY